MLKHLRRISLVLLALTSSAFAYVHPEIGRWAFELDFLYLYPSFDDTYYVIQSSETTIFPNGKRINNDFGFQPAFRVGGVFGSCVCDREFRIFYSRLGAKETETISGSFLWATLGRADLTSAFEDYTGTAFSKLDLLYQRLDLVFAEKLYCSCGLSVYLEGGVEFDYIRLNEHYEYRAGATLGEIYQKSRTWGVGPELGVEIDYEIWNGTCFCPGRLSVVGVGSGALLSCKTKDLAWNALAGATILDVGDETTWRIIPAWHSRIGFNYGMCFPCYSLAFEIGYEFNTYSRALSRMIYPDDVADGQCLTNYYNFDAQGLYISAAVTF